MKITQATIENFDDLSPLKKFSEMKADLVLAFGSPKWFVDPSSLPVTLKKCFPQAIRVGCSSAGEIASGRVLNDNLVITAIQFSSVQLHVHSIDSKDMKQSEDAGRALAKLFPADIGALLVLSPGVEINGSALIDGLRSVLKPGTPITGGLAGDNAKFEKTYTLCNDTISSRQVVGLSFSGKDLGFYHGSFGGWQSFGPGRVVTKCEGNLLLELDSSPALEVYKKYLGEHAAGLPASGLLFPFAILNEDSSESGMIRTILGIDENRGSLTLAGDVKIGSRLKLMHASTDKLVDGAEQAAEIALKMGSAKKEGLALLVSCIGRKLVMGDRIEEETEAVMNVFPENCTQAGFYSYGEISPISGTTDCQLHNQTMTITYLTEK